VTPVRFDRMPDIERRPRALDLAVVQIEEGLKSCIAISVGVGQDLRVRIISLELQSGAEPAARIELQRIVTGVAEVRHRVGSEYDWIREEVDRGSVPVHLVVIRQLPDLSLLDQSPHCGIRQIASACELVDKVQPLASSD